ncbi:hypothetical protein GCM10010954_08530 [Halobacillus andaensis]|uniref:Small peptidoglycan-associated lipoprotein n=1 Tax=Halobacillus andaensis TaxID=1176239 RepID=A0A917B040_HALAA|nr:hypothetical protein [Halobacillus andaensis]MBP2003641.1 hypothetical protein [Halobacillus andaensis]GGF12161.1 hypothetical protein GCM10010954_08530 [Halobacillus andaensis]
MIRFAMSGILIYSLFVILLSGCNAGDEDIKVISAKPSGYEINLYTHPDDEEQAKDYMEALLNWKTSQEDDDFLAFNETTTNTKDIDLTSDQLPALIIYKEGQAIQTITGEDTSPTDIIDTLENTVAITENQNS